MYCILPTGAGYTAYISSIYCMAQCHWLEIAAKKKVYTAYSGIWYLVHTVPAFRSISLGLEGSSPCWMAGALPGGAFLGAQRLTVKPSWCTAPMCFHRLGVSQCWGLGDCEDRNKPSLLFFYNSHPEGVEGLVTYRDFFLDGKAQPCMCYVWLTEHWFGEVSCARVIILWWMLSVQLMWISGRKLMLKTQHRCAFWYNFGACPQSLTQPLKSYHP